MSRCLLTVAVLVASLLVGTAASAAEKVDSMTVTVTSAGNNQFVFQVQNTGDSIISSFVLVLGPGFTTTSLVSATASMCGLAGSNVSCTGLALLPGCPCNPGESVYITLAGSGDPAGTGVVQIVGVAAPATSPATATSPPSSTSPPVQAASSTTPATSVRSTAWTARLSPEREVPEQAVNDATAHGLFKGTLRGTKLSWTLTFASLTGPAMAASIHMAAGGKTGNAVLRLCAPCKSPVTGTATLTSAEIAALGKHLLYVNVHTVKNPNGEIRGQLAGKT
jgi:hypothetical protein